MFKDNLHVRFGALSPFRPHPFIALALFLLMILASEILAAPFLLLLREAARHWDGQLVLTLKYTLSELVLPFGAVMAVVFVWTRRYEKRPIASLGFPKGRVMFTYLEGALLGVGLMALYMLAALGLGVYSLGQMHFPGLGSVVILSSVLLTVPGWIIQGASEEILTRGWLFQATAQKKVLTGIVISSTVFGLIHLANNGLTALSLLNLILYGLFAVFYTLKHENLWAVCGFHSAWNFAQGNLFGISVSGHPILGGSLINPGSPDGPAYLNGGAFGAEGSVIVSGILVLSLLVLFLQLRQKQKRSLKPALAPKEADHADADGQTH